MTDRRDLLRLSAVMVALLVVAGAIMLATQNGGGKDSGPKRGLTQTIVDGRVTEVTPELLVLQPADGKAPMRFAIRATERSQFDIFHLQQHSAEGLLTRVTYQQDGSTLYALKADDAPLPSG